MKTKFPTILETKFQKNQKQTLESQNQLLKAKGRQKQGRGYGGYHCCVKAAFLEM